MQLMPGAYVRVPKNLRSIFIVWLREQEGATDKILNASATAMRQAGFTPREVQLSALPVYSAKREAAPEPLSQWRDGATYSRNSATREIKTRSLSTASLTPCRNTFTATILGEKWLGVVREEKQSERERKRRRE